jgi:medium-chain acyl-[acyl-carrier-protein] hydrolase
MPPKTPWVVVPSPNPSARLRLIGFAHAGGGASLYATWPRQLPWDVELCAVQLPGRESRLDEPPMMRWDDLIAHVTDALAPWMREPFVLFGHSLGALMAYEMARRACGDPRRTCLHLFVSGCRAPHLPLEEPRLHDLPAPAFVDALRELAGTPPEMLETPEMLAHFMPALRADFMLWDTYAHRRADPLNMPLSVYGGLEDPQVSSAMLRAWRGHTLSTFRRVMFRGGHFFVREQHAAVLADLSRELRTIADAVPLDGVLSQTSCSQDGGIA